MHRGLNRKSVGPSCLLRIEVKHVYYVVISLKRTEKLLFSRMKAGFL